MKVGMIINQYEVVSLIKDESVGLCRDKRYGLVRIIKELPNLEEGEILKRMDHRRIPQIVDMIESEMNYLVIDYIKGIDLQAYFHLNKMSNKQLILLFIEIANIMEHVHCMNVIHGDLKPEHIVVNEVGCHLIDFGSAFIERDIGSFTMEYVAPERLLDTYFVDERSDIYSMGKLYKQLLKWYLVHNRMSLINKWVLLKIFKKCTLVNPDDRYQNVMLLKQALSKMIIFH